MNSKVEKIEEGKTVDLASDDCRGMSNVDVQDYVVEQKKSNIL